MLKKSSQQIKKFIRSYTVRPLNIYVNGKKHQVQPGSTIYDATRAILPRHQQIPTLCHHPYVKPTGVCRVCLVQQGPVVHDTSKNTVDFSKDRKWFVPACVTQVQEGMNIWTDTEDVVKNVRDLLKLMLAGHPMECPTCPSNGNCEFQDLLDKYNVAVSDLEPSALERLYDTHLQTSRKRMHEINEALDTFEKFGSVAIQLDREKCIKCTRCIRVCEELQGMCVLGMEWRGRENRVTCFADNESFQLTDCISCGQCSYICPVGAITARSNLKDVRDILRGVTRTKNGERYIVIAQTAPAVRVALSEGWNLEPGTLSDGQMVAGLRAAGFDYVFDTNFTADLTIMEEGNELISRLKSGGPFPMFTSCCPAWINLVEKRYPEFIPNLSTCKSPQGMMGALIKNYWAEKMNVPKERIKVISFMPCTAKKDEANRPQLNHDVDYVLTTREMINLLKLEKIKVPALTDSDFDNPLGKSTGAAVIFGVTGGVMEAALRTCYEVITGKELPKLDFSEVRGFEGIKQSVVDIDGTKLRVAIAHTTGKAQELLEKIKSGEMQFDFIEVMSCQGGCIGGGGEPKVNWKDPNLLPKRLNSIYTRDEKTVLRKSHQNPDIIELYKEYLEKPLGHRSHKYLHTHYTDRSTHKF